MTTELKKKLLSQGILALSQVAFPLFTYPIVTKALGATGLGGISFVDSLAQFLVVVAGLGIPLYGIREIATAPAGNKARIFSEIFLLQLLFILPAVGILFIAGSYSGVDAKLLWIAAANVVASGLSCEWCLQGLEAFRQIAWRSILIRLFAFVLIVLFIHGPGDTALYYLILVGSVGATLLFNLAAVVQNIGFTVKNLQPFPHLKKTGWLYFCYLLIAVVTLLDNFWLGLLASREAVGYYSFGYKLVRMTTMLILSVGVVFIPRIAARLSSATKEDVAEQVRTSQQLIFFLALPAGAFFFLLAPELVQALARSGFEPSIAVIRILSLLPLVVGFSHLTGIQLLVPLHQEKRLFFVLLAAAVMSTALNFLLIPLWQHKAAAIVNVASETVVTLVSSLLLYRQKILRVDVRSFLSSSLFSLSLLPVLWAVRSINGAPLVVLLSSAIVFAAVYVLLHWTLLEESVVKRIFQFKVPA